MRWLVDLLRRLRHTTPPAPVVDRAAVREELMCTDPDFARVRRVHHDALQAITAKGIADGLALRRERTFWERHRGQKP